ncbi:MAG: LysM peptidoglycan-binding domain-containing protein [Fibromonadaceae bacterium]|nr:LysM peptidoglycan-binding domain-containing protein [Fibromonadaceae bacterium]
MNRILFCLMIAQVLYAQMLNAPLLYPFFEKLARLENNKEGKINIVHVGDSHIQSEPLTNAIRKPLQQQFGDGGRGFVFPYTLNKQVGMPYNFATNAAWQTCRNSLPSKCAQGTEFGLSGYGFSTKTDPFVFSIEASDEKYKFNTIKVVSPINSFYNIATVDMNMKPIIHKQKPSITLHRVKRGETLDLIAKKYNVLSATIKKENKMRSSNIYVGRNLRIPITVTETSVDTSIFRSLEYKSQEPLISVYHQDKPISTIYLLPARKQSLYNLNGLVIEKDSSGIIYHSIGSIGAMVSNYNETPLFFKQLPVLTPDLIIVSFGTNESYSSVSAERYIEQIELFVKNIRMFCHNVPIIITTPQISLLRNKKFNTYILGYSNALVRKEDVAIWDLYSFLNRLMGPEKDISATKISKDNVHYTSEGYIKQGTALVKDLLNEYEHYKRSRE